MSNQRVLRVIGN